MRRLITVLVSLFTVVGLSAPAHADITPVTKTGWSRWAGDDRYATAVEVSKATFAPGVGTVYVVLGDDFPDALAAGPVAGANLAPILLTRRDGVPSVVEAELARLEPGLVIVVGGTSVITDATMAALEAASGASAVRFAGADRFATAVRLAHAMEDVQTAYIASGESFADALAAGPAAGSEYAPLLLTRKSSLPTETRNYLTDRPLTKIVIAGGTAAVSKSVEDTIRDLVPSATIVRHAGSDRYDTARLVALAAWPARAETVFYAPGADFPDALAATPAAMVNAAPMLLTTPTCHPFETVVATGELNPSSQVAIGGTKATHSGDTTCGPAPAYPFTRDLNCADFSSQASAQRWFDYWYPRVGDVMGLDRDNDGKVCEVWPPR